MMSFKEIPTGDLYIRPFHALDKEWALLSAGRQGAFNTMTVSWGGVGTLWNLPVATVYVRPQRYTREFIELEDKFMLSFFGGRFKKEMAYLGDNSGRDGDKLAQTPALTPCFDYGEAAPVFEQAGMTLICTKIYCGDISPEGFAERELCEAMYPQKDYHRVFIGRVDKVLVAEK